MAQTYNSPGVYITERDLSVGVGSVPTSDAAFAGVFRWGAIGVPVSIESEPALVSVFGKPTDLNAETFFTASSFLSYARPLKIVRAANTSGNTTDITDTTTNAVSVASGNPSNTVILSSIVRTANEIIGKNWDSSVGFAARWGGAIGNSLKISICDTPEAYQSSINIVANTNIDSAVSSIQFIVGSNTATVVSANSILGTGTDTANNSARIKNLISIGDNIKAGNSSIGEQYLKVTSVSNTTVNGSNNSITIGFDRTYNLAANTTANTINRTWEFYNVVSRPPTTSLHQKVFGANNSVVDQVHAVIIDEDGLFTGIPDSILETFENLSRNREAKNETGKSIYYKEVINNESFYVWAASDLSGTPSGNNASLTASTNTKPYVTSFIAGQDGKSEYNISLSAITAAYDKFANKDEISTNLVLQGLARDGVNGTGLANYLIGNIAENRKDCIVCVSPESTDVVNAGTNTTDRIVEFRNSLTSSSFAILDSGYKSMYDRYNDKYRFVPLNGDIAGIIARSDFENDPWVSPAGKNRGKLKNVVTLAYNPTQAQRETLYRNDINPVIASSGDGFLLYGDKTLYGQESAFSKINVRKLFIIIEQAIKEAAESLLWETNNSLTRSQFVNMVEPYLRDIQSRGGIYDFSVVADTSVNTSEIIDSGGFIGNIIISPARSIDKIRLNFIATRTGVQFDTILSNL